MRRPTHLRSSSRREGTVVAHGALYACGDNDAPLLGVEPRMINVLVHKFRAGLPRDGSFSASCDESARSWPMAGGARISTLCVQGRLLKNSVVSSLRNVSALGSDVAGILGGVLRGLDKAVHGEGVWF
jgi:hypothetical protein